MRPLTRSFAAGIAFALAAPALLSAQAPAPSTSSYVVNDSHFHLTNYVQQGTDIHDHGFQVQASAMAIPKILQPYVGGAQIRGIYGNSSELRAGLNWYVVHDRGLRVNAEWLHLNRVPVGYTAVPYPVGGNGNVFHTNFEMNF